MTLSTEQKVRLQWLLYKFHNQLWSASQPRFYDTLLLCIYVGPARRHMMLCDDLVLIIMQWA